MKVYDYYGTQKVVYEAFSKEFTKGLVETSEKLLKYSNINKRIKRQYNKIFKELQIAEPKKMAKYEQDLNDTKKLIREDNRNSRLDDFDIVKCKNPRPLIANVNVVSYTVDDFKEKLQKLQTSLDRFKEQEKINVDTFMKHYYKMLDVNSDMTRRLYTMKIAAQKTSYFVNKLGYVEEPKHIEEKQKDTNTTIGR